SLPSPRRVAIDGTTLHNESEAPSSAAGSLPGIRLARRYTGSPYAPASRSAAVGSPRRRASRSGASRSIVRFMSVRPPLQLGRGVQQRRPDVEDPADRIEYAIVVNQAIVAVAATSTAS